MDEFLEFAAFATYLGNMGLVLKEKLVDNRMVAYLIGTVIHSFWERYEPIIREMRRRYNLPEIMSMTEYLYKWVKQVLPR